MKGGVGWTLTLAVVVSISASPLVAEDLQLRERAAAPSQTAKNRNNLLSTGCTYRPPPGTRFVELDSRGCPIAPADANAASPPPYPTAVYPQVTAPQAPAPGVQTPATGYYPYPPAVMNPAEGLPPDWTPLPQPNTSTTITKNPDGSSTTTTTPVAPPGWAPPPPAGWQSIPPPVNRWYGPKGTTPSASSDTAGTSGGTTTTPSADGTGVLPSYPVVNPPQGLPPGWTPLPQPNTSTTVTKNPDGSSTTTTTPVAPPGWTPPPPAGWQSTPPPVNRWYGAKGTTP